MTSRSRTSAARPSADPRLASMLIELFDARFYGERTGIDFPDEHAGLEHYLSEGFRQGLDPHPLFDTTYYRRQRPEVEDADENPLVDYVTRGAGDGVDPSPYFDDEYYRSQVEGPARASLIPLLHYVEHARANTACNPNPLFGNGYYLATHGAALAPGETPFGHYLRVGWTEGRLMSRVHQDLVNAAGTGEERRLARGSRTDASVLLVWRGRTGVELAEPAAELVESEKGLQPVTVFLERPDDDPPGGPSPALVLGEFRERCEIFRPSALRLLPLALSPTSPLFALTDVPEIVPGLEAAGIPAYLLVVEAGRSEPLADFARFARSATRVVFGSRELVRYAAGPAGEHPANIALRPYGGAGSGAANGAPSRAGAERYLRSVLELASRDGGELARVAPEPQPGSHASPGAGSARDLLVLCSDWSVSGVNAALEAVGKELARLGWNVEIVFSRDAGWVRETAGGEAGLPGLPYRFLERRRGGADAMWEALIAEVERSAPCVLLTTYDFVANAAIPALTDDVGVVMWLQADDGDYYEQAYRLGRYCNAVVCVSSHIKETLASLHPGIGERAHVIHNASVAEREIVATRPPREDRLRLVYTGRLVQYQKRILDVVDLADALDARGVPYTISLIGTFPPHDEAAAAFPRKAERHLANGSIVLRGRLPRDQILADLATQDIFLLLSEFEGLPLALLEGMAAGCVPVVAEMESGIPEVVTPGRDGIIVRGRDYGEWADVLADLWRDADRLAAMSEQAKQTVRARFTVERAGDAFDRLLADVATEIAAGAYRRPPALHWGKRRSPTGDVLPPPVMYAPVKLPGLA